MAPGDHSGARPAGPVVLRIKLRYDDLDVMVQRFAPNVGKSGLFLPTKSLQPIGAEVKFELRLANDTPVLVGLGRVKHVRAPDPANPRAAFGMAIELMRVTREGREVIIRMIERRRAVGLPDVAIPMPEDVDAAKSQPRADTAGIVREAMAQMASAPMSDQILTARPTTGPVATARLETAPVPLVKEPEPPMKEAEPPPAVSEPEPARPSGRMVRPSSAPFAAPRESGPVAHHAIAALAPEPPRARRPRLQDLIAKAESSGPVVAATAELDEQVDLERALARARVLAGGDMDVELADLRESAAAPIEISVEEASAELARQLGGHAIARRDRSARWAPPPASVPTTLLARGTDPENPVVEVPEPVEARAVDEIAPVEAPAVDEAAPVEARAVEPVVEPAEAAPVDAIETAPVEPVEPDDDDDAFSAAAPGTSTAIDPAALAPEEHAHRPFAPANVEEIATTPGDDPEEPARPRSQTRPPAMLVDDDSDDEIEELDSMDLVPDEEMPSESTQIGAMPVDPNAFQHHGQPTVPDPLVEQLDAHLAAAEAEADAELAGEMRAASQSGYEHAYAEQPYDAQQGYEQQPYGEQSDGEQQRYEQQPYGAQPDGEQQGYEQQPYGAHPDGVQQGYEQQPYDAHPDGVQQGYEQQPYDAQPANEQHYEAQPGYGQHAYAEQPYDAQAGHDQPAYAEQPYAEQPYNQQAYAEQPYNDQAYGEQQPYDQQPYGDPQAYAQQPYNEQAYAEQPQHGQAYGEPDEAQEEVSDFDVLAEADADDADLLSAHGEQEASGNALAAPADEGSFDFASRAQPGEGSFERAAPRPPQGEGSFDYASRLDLGDDSAEHEFSSEAERGYRGGVDMRRARSYGNGYDDGPPAYQDARRQPSYAEERPDYDSFDSPSSYTIAESAPVRPTPFGDDPYGAPAPIAEPSMLRDDPPDDLDLETALEALDVDLDELGAAPDRSKPALPGLPAPRTPTGQVPVRATSAVPPRTPTGQVPVRATGASRTVPPPLPDPETARASARARRVETPARPTKPKRAATEDDGVLIDFDDDD